MTNRHNVVVIDADALAVNGEGIAVSAEDAYRIYVLTGMRSLRRTADLCKLPHGTVLSWSQRYSWRNRARDTDLEVVEGAAVAVQTAIVSQVMRSVEVMGEIRDDVEAPAIARVEAGKTLLREYNTLIQSLGGVGAMSRGDVEDSEVELEELAMTPEGVAVLLERNRKRTGRA